MNLLCVGRMSTGGTDTPTPHVLMTVEEMDVRHSDLSVGWRPGDSHIVFIPFTDPSVLDGNICLHHANKPLKSNDGRDTREALNISVSEVQPNGTGGARLRPPLFEEA